MARNRKKNSARNVVLSPSARAARTLAVAVTSVGLLAGCGVVIAANGVVADQPARWAGAAKVVDVTSVATSTPSSTAAPTYPSPSPSASGSVSGDVPQPMTDPRYRSTRCGNNGDKVFLVFDDVSPTMANFRALIDTARMHNIGIGVAPNGVGVESGRVDPAYARANGMLVIDHTYDHRDLTTLSNSEIEWEITRPQVRSNYVRPPYGAYNSRVASVLARHGKFNCMWNLDPRDWDGKSPSAAADYIVRNAQPGTTAVVHLNHMGTVASTLVDIKRGLAARGLQLCAPWGKPAKNVMPARYC